MWKVFIYLSIFGSCSLYDGAAEERRGCGERCLLAMAAGPGGERRGSVPQPFNADRPSSTRGNWNKLLTAIAF